MQDKAVQIIQTMLKARDMEVSEIKSITAKEGLDDRTSVYSVGPVLVIFSSKDRGIMEKEFKSYISFAGANKYNAGVIIVLMAPPSEGIMKAVRAATKYHVHVFHIRELQYDITQHRIWVPHRILKEEERKVVFETYKISKPEEQLPWISSQDKAARWIGAVPGDVVEIKRHSDSAGNYLYYRYCVEDENVN
jgi:DNA-directed RNA polymerase subunit H (RpoH/RPB5)